jgi:Flp pilus assembly protein TadG
MSMRRPSLLARDGSGTAAIEFALILPVLVTLFFGTVEIANLTLAYMKLVSAAETVADLVTQQTTVSSTDIDNIAQAGKLVLTPLPPAPFGVAIASVTFNPANGNPTLAWQDTRNAAAMTSPTTLAAGYGSAGDSVVIVVATYSYISPISYILTGAITLSETAYLRPRLSAAVAHS